MPLPPVDVFTVRGAAIGPFIPDAARLRIAVFREWPYLYEGDDAYEREYLRTYRDNPDSLFVIARAGGEVIGLSTGIPLQAETEEVKGPFLAAGIDPATVFYFGESMLLPDWRGRGLGVKFFEERKRYARSLPGIRHAAFCAVDRPADHPARPADYVPLDSFWVHRGFAKTALRTGFTWKEIGEVEASPKQLTFWMKALL
ncbi:MAG: GNAT family N-acetyltransferase [Verrucomicrobiota bacterium]